MVSKSNHMCSFPTVHRFTGPIVQVTASYAIKRRYIINIVIEAYSKWRGQVNASQVISTVNQIYIDIRLCMPCLYHLEANAGPGAVGASKYLDASDDFWTRPVIYD